MATTKATTKKKGATTKKKKATVKEPVVKVAAKEKYTYAVGRRKTAVAQVRFFAGAKDETFNILVNDRPYEQYFNTFVQRQAVVAPFKATGKTAAKVTVHVKGGGLSGQADAIKLGIARALIVVDPLLRPVLKAQKLLTRDSRAVERKKPGLKKARRAPQWSKR